MSIFRRTHFFAITLASFSLLTVSVWATTDPQKQTGPKAVDPAKEVEFQLIMLPNYSVFDNLSAKIEGSNVVLTGQVLHPKLKFDAEAAVKKVKGVTRVQNDVELLPNLSSDDQVRRAAYRAIYGDPALSRYRYSEKPQIHIVVEKGIVSLEGAVYDASDATVAGLRAKAVPNVSLVKNNLGIQGPPAP
jgi:hyperosmotically inducible protein